MHVWISSYLYITIGQSWPMINCIFVFLYTLTLLTPPSQKNKIKKTLLTPKIHVEVGQNQYGF